MKLTPLHDWVLVRTGEPRDKSAGGIIIPDTAQEAPEEGEVLAVGTGRLIEDKDSKEKIKKKTFVKTTLRPGEHILYKKYVATEVEVDDEKLVLVREEDVLATDAGETAIETGS
jgi:chaperonin GroES